MLSVFKPPEYVVLGASGVGFVMNRNDFNRKLSGQPIHQMVNDSIWFRTFLGKVRNLYLLIRYGPKVTTGLVCNLGLGNDDYKIFLTLKYYVSETILDPIGGIVSWKYVDIIHDLQKDQFKVFPDESDPFIHFDTLQLPHIPTNLPDPHLKSSIQLVISNDNIVTFDGQKLYDLTKNGIIGTVIRLSQKDPNTLSQIQINKPFITMRVLQGLKYLSESLRRVKDAQSAKYFLMDELADPMFQAYAEAQDLRSWTTEKESLILRLPTYDYEVAIPRERLSLYPDSLLGTILRWDPLVKVIPLTHPLATPEVINSIKILFETEFTYDPTFVEAAGYLNVPELANPIMSALVDE